MAACKLASKGKTMADSSYDAEVAAIQSFLSLQHPVICTPQNSTTTTIAPSQADIQPEDYVAPRFIKKGRAKAVSSSLISHILHMLYDR